MRATVYGIEDGYAIRGEEPPGLRAQPEAVRLMFYGWVVEEGMRQKDRDLSMGLDKDGKPLRRIKKSTRLHRHSAMTPTGRGDPSAPPLEPGRQKSRVRSLLTGRAYPDHAAFWWKYDAFTGESFAEILRYQKDQGRDVFGLSPAALRRTMARAWEKYRRWEQGKTVELPRPITIPQARRIEVAGTTDLSLATTGIGMPARPGQWAGGMRIEDWIRRMREPAKVAIPGRPGSNYNRLLGHVWGGQQPPRAAARAALRPGPKTPPPPKVEPSRATLAHADEGWEKVARKVVGRKVSAQDILDAAGAPDGQASITIAARDEIQVVVQSPRFTMSRAIRTGADDRPMLQAISFYVEPEHQGKGIGADVFGRMIEASRRLGLAKIRAHAAKSERENGYYTWPKFGYDGPIPAHLKARLPASLAGAERISDLMATPEGDQWWKENGTTVDLVFDLAPGSASMRMWAAYLAARARTKG